MSKLFYVTLNQGRTDNVYVWATSKENVLSFFKSVSTANVTIIKEILYSKDFLVGTNGVRAFSPQAHDQEIKVLFNTLNHTDMITLRYPKATLTNEKIQTYMKNHLGLKDEVITDFISIVKR